MRLVIAAIIVATFFANSLRAEIPLSPADQPSRPRIERDQPAPGPLRRSTDEPRPAALPQLQIVVSLTDGSRILGTPSFKSVPVETSFTKAEIDLKLLEALEFDAQSETAVLRLRNGDRLQGRILLKQLELTTAFGRVTIPLQHVRVLTTEAGEPSAGLVLHYSFDEDHGKIVKNQVGEPLDGELAGATWTPQGKSNGAIRFRGNGDKVIIPHDKRLDLGRGDFSFCLWFKADRVGRQQLLWHHYNPEVQLEPDGKLLAYFAFQFCGTLATKSTVGANEWHFVVMTRRQGLGRIYLDGREENSVDAATCDSSSPQPLLLGVDGEMGEPFAGIIDEVAFWRRALSDAEIRDLYRGTAP